MNKILRQIQEAVEKYTNIMAQVSGVDVEVVDVSLFRVAGTGMFAQNVNKDMSDEGYAYRQVLDTGKLQVIYEPGRDRICQNCPKLGSCAEKIEIAMPIRVGKSIIGVIGLVGSTVEERDHILKNETTYLGLIEQIASFIAAKAAETLDQQRRQELLSALACTINHMEQGLLILSHTDTITMSNQAAQEHLGSKNASLVGLQASLTPTGDRINDQDEYDLTVDGRSIPILGELYVCESGAADYAKVLAFTPASNMRRQMYAMTAAVGPKTLVGTSPETTALRAEIKKVARGSSTVLITGESGTGKEVTATAIWKASPRSEGQFVAINCAAIPESILESELFGYVKGAFTGADSRGRVGKFELANGGVIFLDEIGDMPLYLQVKLLRVLQERKITRLGSNQVIPIDVRVIAATNKDLKAMIEDGKFREDLYYRLNVIPIHIPPLRERKSDIRDLAEVFVKRYAARLERPHCTILPDAMAALLEYPWYGNVRELENTIEFMVNMGDSDGQLGTETLPRDFLAQRKATLPRVPQPPLAVEASLRPLRELEAEEIQKALQVYGESTEGKRRAARALGIGVATLYRKLENFQK